MNITPVSFGMSAIFTKKGKDQFVKIAASSPENKVDEFVKAGDEFKRRMESTKHVDVVVDKKGILFPRLKATVIDKTTKKPIAKTQQMPWEAKIQSAASFFERSTRMTEKADKAAATSETF